MLQELDKKSTGGESILLCGSREHVFYKRLTNTEYSFLVIKDTVYCWDNIAFPVQP